MWEERFEIEISKWLQVWAIDAFGQASIVSYSFLSFALNEGEFMNVSDLGFSQFM